MAAQAPPATHARGTRRRASWCGRSIPCRARANSATTPGAENSARNRSGVNVWGYMSLDAERGILYMPLGAPNNDRVGTDRPGNNLFSSSVVAVDANTGKYLWHFQVVHHDIWDYDTQSAPLVVDLQRGGDDDSRASSSSTRPGCCSRSTASPASRSSTSKSVRCRRATCPASRRRRRSRSRSSPSR